MNSFKLSFLFLFSATLLQARPPQGLKFENLNFVPPKVEQYLLTSGTTLYLLVDHELPLIQMNILMKTGSMYEPNDQVGLASLCSALLRNGGTQRTTADQIDQELESLGASIETGMDTESANVSLSCLSKDLDRTLELLFEILQSPSFNKKKLEIEKAKAIETIRRRNDEPFSIARREIRKILYGPNHPLSRTSEIPSIKKIKRKDIVKFHKKYYYPNNMRIAVSGDFKSEELIKKIEAHFQGWENEEIRFPEVPQMIQQPKEGKRTVGLAEKNLSQASIILAQLGIKRHNPDRFSLEVMNEILGGAAFTSRLYKEVRGRLGLVYWIGSNFSEPWDFGTIGIGCQTKNSTAGKVIEMIQKIAQNLSETAVNKEELEAAKEAIINSFVFRYSSSQAIVSQKMSLDYFGYPPNYLETYTEKIAKISAQDIQEVAKKYLKPSEMTIMLVGNSKQFDAPPDSWGKVKAIDLKIDE